MSIGAFLLVQNETGLYVVTAAYGFGFAGIILTYVVSIRDLFPPEEASWRIPLVLFTAMSGMAFGGWFAGRIYDRSDFYAPAFGSGVMFNLINLALIDFLVMRPQGRARIVKVPVAAYAIDEDAPLARVGRSLDDML